MGRLNNTRISNSSPIVTPAELGGEFPITRELEEVVSQGRKGVTDILAGRDPRMIGVVGPCSIHSEEVALDYAKRLADLSHRVESRILLIMRVYFEKPRTTVGWRGLITDPFLDGTYAAEAGIRLARKILMEITRMGLPTATEVLDPVVPQYTSQLTSWAAIGARTTESQTHRNIAGGLSMPVGFKNGTDGNIATAINALEAAMSPNSFIGIDEEGRTCMLNTTGNPSVHMILRGGRKGPNYYEEYVEVAERSMKELGLNPAIIVDCSHGNSGKDPTRQRRVLRSVLAQRMYGRKSLAGFMLESNIAAGSQKILPDVGELKYGVSLTDPCIGWEETEELIRLAYHDLG